VFNACYSRPLAEAVAAEVGCAVGSSRSIPDQEAIHFAGTLYLALAFGRSVRTAFDLARAALKLDGIPEVAEIDLVEGPKTDAATLVFGGPQASGTLAQGDDRDRLVGKLANLDGVSFDELVMKVRGAGRVDAPLLPVPQRAARLVAYAEGANGPGLDALDRALRSLS